MKRFLVGRHSSSMPWSQQVVDCCRRYTRSLRDALKNIPMGSSNSIERKWFFQMVLSLYVEGGGLRLESWSYAQVQISSFGHSAVTARRKASSSMDTVDKPSKSSRCALAAPAMLPDTDGKKTFSAENSKVEGRSDIRSSNCHELRCP